MPNRFDIRKTFAGLLAVVIAMPAAAEEVLHLYGPSGPSPAMHEAAIAFQQEAGVRVEVTEGPANVWLPKARENADLVFSSAEYMMTDLQRQNGGLGIVPETVTPLYLRTAALLVRPGNPKEIHDFPDLLKPDLRIMVVHGSGQMGLWEDMAGAFGNIRSVRALRKNIQVISGTSDEAYELWTKRPEIDAWITWNTWFRPLHDQALLVPVSDEFRVQRMCSIALTERGRQQPAAQKFIDFLLSDAGADIFGSWGWVHATPKSRTVAVDKDIWIACEIQKNESKNGVGTGLQCAERLLDHYGRAGIPASEIHLYVILEAEVASWALSDAKYREATGQSNGNPNRELIRKLALRGVHFELCSCSTEGKGWTPEDLLPEVRMIPCGCQRIIDLQLQGAASIRF